MTIYYNVYVGSARMSPHAMERWDERANQSVVLADSFKRAVPFGGQYGENLLLKDGDIVFATEKVGRYRIVKTVLTDEQAIANMEMNVWKPHTVIQPSAMLPVSSEYVAPRPKKSKPNVPSLSTEMARREVMKALEKNDDGLAVEVQKAEGEWLNFLQREVKRREKEKRTIAHVHYTEREVARLKIALREVVSAEQLQAIWDKKREIEIAEGRR